MIVLEVIEDRGAGAVVDEFRALVKKRTVVLIGLDHEKQGAAQPRRYRKILRHSADQKARAHARMFKHPRQHAAGGSLAVGPGDSHDPAALQHMIGQPLRPGHIGQPLVEHVLDGGIATRQGIADYHQIGRRIQLGGVITLGQLDALSL